MYNGLVERCFVDCVNDFTTNSLGSKEVCVPSSLLLFILHFVGCSSHLLCHCCLQDGCVNRCCDKFMKHSARVGARFAEQNPALQQGAADLAGPPKSQ